MSSSNKASGNRTGGRCPICNEPAGADYHPFCSKRCADVDLNRWLSGTYAIPGEPVAIPDAEEGEESGNNGDER